MPTYTPTYIHLGNTPTLFNADYSTGSATSLAEANAFASTNLTYDASEMQGVQISADSTNAFNIERGSSLIDYTIQQYDANGDPISSTDVENVVYAGHIVMDITVATQRLSADGTMIEDGPDVDLRAVVIQMSNGDMFVRPYYLDVQIWEDTLNEYGIAEIALNNVHTFTDGTDPDTNTDRGVGGLNGEASFPPRFVGKLDEPVPCFAAGTLIDTPTGPVPVETLEIGSLVMTRDHGAQPVHWIARKLLDAAELTRRSHLHPIRISPGALGDGTPTTDLVVSPQHRVLVRSPIAQRMFGTAEVLVAAKALVGVDGVAVADDIKQVEYVHFLLQQHEVVIANGAQTESLYLGPEAIKAIGQKAIDELLSIFPELSDQHDAPTPARPLISVHRAKGLARRHQKNSKGLIGQ